MSTRLRLRLRLWDVKGREIMQAIERGWVVDDALSAWQWQWRRFLGHRDRAAI